MSRKKIHIFKKLIGPSLALAFVLQIAILFCFAMEQPGYNSLTTGQSDK